MEVGRGRGRRRHGTREPCVERRLGRLGEGTHQDQHERHRHGRATGRIGQDRAERRGASGLPEQHEAAEHRQSTCPGDQESLHRGAPGPGPFDVGPDEHEGADGGELPEHVQREQVVRDDQPEHRSTERDQQRGGANGLGPGREVGAGVDADQHADAGDEAEHQQREAREAERQLEAERGNPAHALGHGAAVGHVAALPGSPHQRRDEGHGGDVEDPCPERTGAERKDRGDGDEGQQQDEQLISSSRSSGSRSSGWSRSSGCRPSGSVTGWCASVPA